MDRTPTRACRETPLKRSIRSPAPLPTVSSRRSLKLSLIERLRAEVFATAPLGNHCGCAVYASHVAQAPEAQGLICWGVLTSQLHDDDLNIVRNQSSPQSLATPVIRAAVRRHLSSAHVLDYLHSTVIT